ncbi:sulfatase-like hydrolase/transferase [Novipirellula artificiosorum]|uniref:Sulfatase n=1 Tax=Novipirellula artificiosorum TaxID=2528016 RepID=A0A5C6DNK0_9BACT|nr:sulfatase-like hydrolase/transferase [Novipirellula artificiosorum]TWU38298.1 Sulfatase [Novipirellula artificiosorum]
MDKPLRLLFDFVRGDDELRKNTLIVFCSDNGPDPKTFAPGTKPLRGSKATLDENGVRSPLIVWGPGMVSTEKAGTRDAQTVLAAFDLAPSLLRLTGMEPSEKHSFDGEDMLDAILGHRSLARAEPLYFSRPPDFKDFGIEKGLPDLAIRKGNWKLLCDYDGGRPQLYNLATDPSESRSSADLKPELTKTLVKELTRWYQEIQPSKVTSTNNE